MTNRLLPVHDQNLNMAIAILQKSRFDQDNDPLRYVWSVNFRARLDALNVRRDGIR
jgi:hypothetical protein